MDAEAPAKPLHHADQRTWFGHPRGLSTLFFSEMWERFSYYGMRALLVLYLSAPKDIGGMGLSKMEAGVIYGMYTAMVYLAGVPGGWIADKFMGLRNAVLVGGVLIMAGHIGLALPWEDSFYLGLVLIVLGTGLLKPCISTLVGQLYAADDKRRDAGFSVYYMGINVGALIAPLACGFLAQHEAFKSFLVGLGISSRSSWHFGFGAAAVGMGLGLVQYVVGLRHLGDAGRRPAPPADPKIRDRNRTILAAILVALFGLPALIGALAHADVLLVTKDRLNDWTGYLLLVLSIAVFGGLFVLGKFSGEERRRLLVVMLLFFGAAIFFACFEQAGSTMSMFAEVNTRNSLLGFAWPSSWWQSVNSACVIVFAPMFAWLWLKLGPRDPSAPAKFGVAMVLVALSFLWLVIPANQIAANPTGPTGSPTLVSPVWLLGLFVIQTWAELCLSPVGLSSMTKLAPQAIGGLVMGIWFLGAAIGNWASGKIASNYESVPLQSIFLLSAALPAVAALIFFALVKPINRMLARPS